MSKIIIPAPHDFLNTITSPRMVAVAASLYGVIEGHGSADNPVILGWANEVGARLGVEYGHDEIPWCGLFMAVVAQRAGKVLPPIAVRAASWRQFGKPSPHPMFGDVLVFTRDQGGHVALYIGEDDANYHVLGGNQHDMVCVAKLARNRLIDARRPEYHVQPANVAVRVIAPSAEHQSINEA